MNNRESIKKTYYVAIGLFCALFIGSVLLSVIDTKGSYEQFAQLNFPSWLLYPLSIAKTLGVVALLKSESRSLKDFAFAGFLYDMLLALGGHISVGELYVVVPIAGLCLWVFAFVMDRKYDALKFGETVENQ